MITFIYSRSFFFSSLFERIEHGMNLKISQLKKSISVNSWPKANDFGIQTFWAQYFE